MLVQGSFNEMWKKKWKNFGNPFKLKITPENAESLGVPDYFEYIKKPMNLFMIKGKLDSFAYESIDEIIEDVHLMCNNAMTYNREGEPVYQYAKTLKNGFDARITKIKMHQASNKKISKEESLTNNNSTTTKVSSTSSTMRRRQTLDKNNEEEVIRENKIEQQTHYFTRKRRCTQ